MLELSEAQLNSLSAWMSSSADRATTTLNSVVNHRFQISISDVKLVETNLLQDHISYAESGLLTSVQLAFGGAFEGCAVLLVSQETAGILIASLTDETQDSMDMDELKSGTLMEIGSVVINSMMGTVTDLLKVVLRYAVPAYAECDLDQIGDLCGDHKDRSLLLAEVSFIVDDLEVNGTIMFCFQTSLYKEMMQSVERGLVI